MAESMIYGSGKVSRSEAKVSKFGDKVYGYINYVQQFTDGVAPDANTFGLAAPRFMDAEGYLLGYLAPYFQSGGEQELVLRTFRMIGNTQYNQYFAMGVDTVGNPTWRFSAPNAIRKAIMLNESTTFASLADLVTYLSDFSTGQVIICRCGTAIQLFNATSSYNGIAIIAKASTSNAYYLAYNRDKCSIGNISLANGTISIRHNIVT